jgi:NhaA family Na+:H+ antiporter
VTDARPTRLDRPVDASVDHILGHASAPITLVEYGSYACPHCHVAHEVVANLRDRFGERLRYVFRHLPLADREQATRAAEMAEYASAAGVDFWRAHDALMQRGPILEREQLDGIADELGVPPRDTRDPDLARRAAHRVREDARSGIRSGARVTPTFFINGRRYEGAWDEASLGEALIGSLGHRIHTASVNFARWAPSTGLLLILMSGLAVVLSNTANGPAFEAFWHRQAGLHFGNASFTLPLLDWVNHGLLTVFFLVVGLEIKRELTVGRLATRRAAAFPVAAAFGGMTAPALIYAALAPAALAHGWGTTIATDTAFAVALIVLLGDRVPVDLRVFLTAAVIADDLVAIVVVALFYSGDIHLASIAVAGALTLLLVAFNNWGVYRALPYAVVGVLLWLSLHQAGLHATLAGVILAALTPTRPPANLNALMAQAEAVLRSEVRSAGDAVMRHGPSEPALRQLDAIHDRIESPASKVLRHVEPWSSYAVLPIFALANAGVAWAPGVLDGHLRLVLAIVLGLVLGKPLGIVVGAWIAERTGIAEKPASYSWRQLAGAGAIAGIGFTMSLFIAGQAFPGAAEFTAAKLAIFMASILAGTLGSAILWKRARAIETHPTHETGSMVAVTAAEA